MQPEAVVSEDYADLARIARQIRRDIIIMTAAAGSGHPGGSLSSADILAALYWRVLRIDPRNPYDPDRDRFVLSKGHCSPALYAALAERGFFPREWLTSFRKLHSPLQGHPDMKKLPGVEMSTGALGQGFSTAVGMALAARVDGRDYRVYALLGDGECQTGQVWEAAMSAAHYRLDNLVAIVDRNGLQIDGPTEQVMALEPLPDKWRSFGWHTLVIDGHSFPEILGAFEEARRTKGRPTAIIAKTIKGRGVSFMENVVDWHGVAPNQEQRDRALAELGGEG
jgi:transketolase